MQQDHWPSLAFEKIDAGRDRSATYVLVLIALICGLSMLLIGASTGMRLLGLVLVAGACIGQAHLLRAAPRLRYFRYFWLDQYGVHHIEGNSPSDRTAHFAWHEIGCAEASTDTDDFRGVTLKLNRPGMRDVPILLSMGDMKDVERTAAAINDIVRTTSQPANRGSGAQVSWWLDWGALPERRIWARLTVDRAGTATVLDCDGKTHRFTSEADARNWLYEDEYSMLQNLLDEYDLAGVCPPSAPTDAALVAKMKGHHRECQP